MSEKNIEVYSLDEELEDRSDWERVKRLTDEEIEAAVREDPDAPELLGAERFEEAELVVPGEKQRVTMEVDRDVIEYFKREGCGYQTRMNAVLKAYVLTHERERPEKQR